jgi:hypothetical protein
MNFVRQYKGKKVIYDIEMTAPYASQSIRDSYGLFWRRRSGRRLPDDLKGISFSNAVTFPTRIRIRLLKELCRRHQQANPTLSCFVTSYLARPELKIRDRRGFVTSLTYTEAVQQLSHHLTHDFLRELYLFAKTNLPEREVFERFLVLTPDLLTDNVAEPMSIDPAPEVQVHPLAPAQGPPVPTAAAQPPSGSIVSPVVNTPPNTLFGSTAPTSSPVVVAVATTASSQPTLTPTTPSSSPTFATLTNVVLTPPQLSSQAVAPVAINTGASTASDGDFTVVSKRNRNRFSKKSVPYPQNR